MLGTAMKICKWMGFVLPEADMLAVVTDLGDVGVIMAMAEAMAAAIAAAADSLWLWNKSIESAH